MTFSGLATRRCASPIPKKGRRHSRRLRTSGTCGYATRATRRSRWRNGWERFVRWGRDGPTRTSSLSMKGRGRARSSPRSSGRFSLSLRRFALGCALAALQARLERFHQVEDLRLRRLGRFLGDLLALDLLLDLVEDTAAHIVLVRRGLEFL